MADHEPLHVISENVQALADFFVKRKRFFAPLLAIVTAAIAVPLAALLAAADHPVLVRVPARHVEGPVRGQPPDRLHLPRRRRQRGRPSRRDHRQAADAGADAGLSAGRLHRDGGPRLLFAFRVLGARPDPRDVDQLARRPHGAGRLHHHAADREDRVPQPGTHDEPQDGGAGRRGEAREIADQEADPGALSQPHLSGLRRLWRGRRGACLFQQIGERTDAARGRDAGDADARALRLLAAARPGAGPGARRDRAARHGGDRRDQPGRCRRRQGRPRRGRRPRRPRHAELLLRHRRRRGDAACDA